MSEAILVKGSSGIDEIAVENIIANYMASQQPGNAFFTSNTTFIVPKNGLYTVTCIGGGGGPGGPCAFDYWPYHGARGGGGGGGWSNTGTFQLNKRDIININIGVGGGVAQSGGTTFFGSYLSAIGGSCGNNGWKTSTNSFVAGIGGPGFRSGNNGYYQIFDRSGPTTDINHYYPQPNANDGFGGIGFKSPISLDDGWVYGYGGNSGRGAWGGGATSGGNGCVYISWS